MTAPLPELRLYTLPGCHLCEEARDAIQSALEDRASRGRPVPTVVELDIEADPELHRKYLERIPVVEIDGRRLELLVTAGKVRRMLADVLDATTV